MRLRNKKTGEIVTVEYSAPEETKASWHISCRGEIIMNLDLDNQFKTDKKLIGNHFKTKEEAERAVEKLRAWKRLRDKGFRFEGFGDGGIYFSFPRAFENDESQEDIRLLFGDEK